MWGLPQRLKKRIWDLPQWSQQEFAHPQIIVVVPSKILPLVCCDLKIPMLLQGLSQVQFRVSLSCHNVED